MIIFWILAAGLTGLAVLFIVWPLLRVPTADTALSQGQLNLEVFRRRRDELDGDLAAGVLVREQYDAARKDLERELLYDLGGDADAAPGGVAASRRTGDGRAPILALILGVALPVAAVLAYLQLGDQGVIPRIEAAGAETGEAAPADPQATQSLEVLAQGLAERMQKTPDNLDGWLMLGRTYFAIAQPAKGLEALERAYQLAPEQAGVLAAYAEALGANAGNRLSGRPAELIRTALRLEPANPNARWLAGMLDYQEGRFSAAVQTWQGLLSELDPAGQEAQQLGAMIAEAQGQAGTPSAAAEAPAPNADAAPPAPAAVAGQAETAAGDAGARIQVSVTLAPALAAQAAPDDTVFVFARAPAGPPMPLAVQRLKVADLPATLSLDDSMAVIPTLRLSGYPEVLVGARISKSGQATPAAGDLEGEAGPVKASGGSAVVVAIDRVRP
ncbi:c-type cytochrome biogenesis protein CcmI [uncultured Thiodictyon sp.]|jgi:cytochrome c-type biogenesis protein CcmH|uniref:c-type cytochrome biogenesis protein CcmI n=1 Tax=uncultured Thiodictyon sp. TaxID=1846217 RepID=UPI0025FF6994|nr:c-type cytochrome biogenesis protein CcmI [uncultured Thiodictyon sp.]